MPEVWQTAQEPAGRLDAEEAVARLLEAEAAARDALARSEAQAAARLEAARERARALLERSERRVAAASAAHRERIARELAQLRSEARGLGAAQAADDPRLDRLENAVARLAARMTGAGDGR